jgi:uncharacterized protein (AIM24 family)
MRKVLGLFSKKGKAKKQSQNYVYRILGVESQVIEFKLSPYQMVRVEPHSIMYIDPGVTLSTGVVDGLASGVSRVLTGSTLFLVSLTNEHPQRSAKVAVSSGHYSRIQEFDLSSFPSGLTFTTDSYLCSGPSVELSAVIQPLSVTVSQQSLFLQHFHGKGSVFIKTGVNPSTLSLQAGQSVVVAANALLGFTDGVAMQFALSPHVQNWVETANLVMVRLSGPGQVFVQNTTKAEFEAGLAKTLAKSALWSALGYLGEHDWPRPEPNCPTAEGTGEHSENHETQGKDEEWAGNDDDSSPIDCN